MAKAAHEAAQKKAAKQKKILIVLGIAMLAALVYAYMTLTSMGSKSDVAATPAAQTTPAGAIPTADAPVTPGVAAVPVGTLSSFVSLGGKDPFFDGGPHATTAKPSSSSSTSKADTKKNDKGNTNGGSQTNQPSAPLTGAVISLNGDKLALAVGATFGHAPGLSGVSLFRLQTVTPKTAEVDVVGTQQHFTLHVGKPLTLEQQGGWKYTLILEPLGSAAPMTVQTTTTTTTDF